MRARYVERRREPRYPVNILVEIHPGAARSRRVGVSRNAGSGGVLIATRGRLEAGEAVRIAFRVRRDGRMRELEGRVVRCDTSPDAEVYPHLIAVHLSRPSPELLSAEPGSPRG